MATPGRQEPFSKVVQTAKTDGPQVVTLRGERAAVILSAEDYDDMIAERPTLVDHLLSEPAWDDDLAAAVTMRSKVPSRDVEF